MGAPGGRGGNSRGRGEGLVRARGRKEAEGFLGELGAPPVSGERAAEARSGCSRAGKGRPGNTRAREFDWRRSSSTRGDRLLCGASSP